MLSLLLPSLLLTSTKVHDYLVTFDDEVHTLIASTLCDSELNNFEAGISVELEVGDIQDPVSVVSLSTICAVGGRYLP